MCVRENLDIGGEGNLEELGVEVSLIGGCSSSWAGGIEEVSYKVEALQSDDMNLRKSGQSMIRKTSGREEGES